MSDTRVFMYRGEEARIFNSPEEVPEGEGWCDNPVSAEKISIPEEVNKGDVEVSEPEKVEEAPKAKRKYNRKK